MVSYVLKSGDSYVKSTRYGVSKEILQLKEEAEKAGNEMEAKSYQKAITHQIEEQVFSDSQNEALAFDSIKELDEFFSRNLDSYLANEYFYHVETVFKKG
jgi:predicted component of type VI protein secretion system